MYPTRVVQHVYFYNLFFMKSSRIIFVLATSCYRVIMQNLWQETKSAPFYIICRIIYIFVWKGSIVDSILFYSIFWNGRKNSVISLFSHVSLLCSNSLRYRLTDQTRESRLVDSRVRLSRGCDSFRKTLHWILDAFPTVVNAKESGFLAIASRDSPHFRFNGVDTRNPEALFCEGPQILHARLVYRFNCTQFRARYETYLLDAPEYPPRWLA